ncbi:MAG: TolC family protein [Planctomycetota bacterium]
MGLYKWVDWGKGKALVGYGFQVALAGLGIRVDSSFQSGPMTTAYRSTQKPMLSIYHRSVYCLARLMLGQVMVLALSPYGRAQESTEFTMAPEAIQRGIVEVAVEPQVSTPETEALGNTLTLVDVMASVLSSFPEIQRARLIGGEAQGDLVSAYGAFDTKIEGYTLSEPTGFYRNFRQGLGLSRRTWWGGYLAAGYRLGRGDFQPWYKERETNEGGEFKLALGVPLLQGRAIDPSRVAVFQANLGRQAVQPSVQQSLLAASRDASDLYWQWLASGSKQAIQMKLLELAQRRAKKYERGAEAGEFADVDVVLNRQLVAERTSAMLQAEQKALQAGLKLSLYLRDELGNPNVPPPAWLPDRFPENYALEAFSLQQEIAMAAGRRPEIALLNLEIQSQRIDLRLASNQLLPTIDLYAEGSQDVGVPASSSNDKGQFELLAGLQGSVPIQRRKARGKIQATNAKIAQLSQKIRLQRDKIGVEIQVAENALRLAEQILIQNKIALEAAFDSLRRYGFAFDRGYVDLIYLNLIETKAFETEAKLIDAQRDWFIALTRLQIAMGLDPLSQAMKIADLPPSDYLGPNDMPRDLRQVPEGFEEDWQLHQRSPQGQ